VSLSAYCDLVSDMTIDKRAGLANFNSHAEYILSGLRQLGQGQLLFPFVTTVVLLSVSTVGFRELYGAIKDPGLSFGNSALMYALLSC
jgi:hypothetical protein